MLAVENITKRFPGVMALNKVCMELPAGKVTALIGENGAGKSTLMKILSGVYADYEGTIYFNGKPVRFANIREAQACGIAIIHQELNLIPYLSVWENIFLGRELLNKWGFLDKKKMIAQTQSLLQKLKLEIDPAVAISLLKVGQQQVVEIAKALLTNSHIIIMDEPTSAISDKEVAVLFSIISDLKKENKAVVYISHKLDELFKIADRYVVLRDGCSVQSGEMKNITENQLIEKMVGREIQMIRKPTAEQKLRQVLLSAENICLSHPGNKSVQVLKNVSFQISKGEIVGLFGLMGAGRTELMETLFGLHPKRMSGNFYVDGQPVSFRSPSDAIKAGIALVPEDRKKDGLVLGLDVRTNISLTVLDEMETSGFINNSREASLSQKYIDELRIKTTTDKVSAKSLSGGNQQKIVLAKWLAKHPKLLLLDEPTRGVDVHAKNEIYKLIIDLAGRGLAIILVSSELPEIFAVSDRVLVLSEGVITTEVPIAEATESIILKAAIPKTI